MKIERTNPTGFSCCICGEEERAGFFIHWIPEKGETVICDSCAVFVSSALAKHLKGEKLING